MNLRYIPFLLIVLLSLSAKGQYNPTIDVEGTYKPDVIDLDRVNLFPEIPRLSVAPGSLQFDLHGVVANFSPEGVPMEATGWGINAPAYRGFVHAGLGSWLDARLTAGYRFIDNRATTAGVWIDHNSTSLWKPYKDLPEADLKRKLYDEKIGICLSHRIDDYGTLHATAKYNFAYFNYYGYPSADLDQSLNDASLALLWRGDRHRSFRIDAKADVRYTGYRTLYLPPFTLLPEGYESSMSPQRISGARDTRIGLALDMSKSLSARSHRIGLSLNGDIVATGGMDGGENYITYSPASYGMITAEPYYLYEKDNLKFKAGARMDFPVNTKSPDARLSAVTYLFPGYTESKNFYISPDLRFDIAGKQIGVEARIMGGAHLYSLATARDIDFYCQPGMWNTLPEYSPLDASAVLRVGPFAGFQFRISGAYRIMHGQRTGGLYSLLLNQGLTDTNDNSSPMILALADRTVDVAGGSLGVGISYEYGPEFRISAEGSWQPQHKKTSYFNGFDLPELTATVNVESNPWKSLKLGLRYDLRALRHPLAHEAFLIDSDAPLFNIAMDNWSDLSFRASYEIFNNFTLGATVKNILNRSQELLPYLPVPGITALGTITWRF